MSSAEADSKPRISVLIPVYRDWDRLCLCLNALRRQTLAASDFEVIVINNDTAPLPEDFPHAGVHWVHAPQGHSYSARNAGLAIAQGEVLAFTDADCEPDPNWLTAGWQALQASTAALVGGRIGIAVTQRNVATDFDQAFAFRQAETVRNGHSVTANLFVRHEVFDVVGPFNEQMQSGGDFELCSRAIRAGFQLVYAEHALVWHPARDSLTALFRKNRRVAGGFRRREFDLRRQGLRARLRFVVSMLRPRLRYWWRLLRGTEKTEALPVLRRPAVVVVQVLLHYHFAWSVLRAPPGKDQH
jgi:GT2 family glycosyltransferase